MKEEESIETPKKRMIFAALHYARELKHTVLYASVLMPKVDITDCIVSPTMSFLSPSLNILNPRFPKSQTPE